MVNFSAYDAAKTSPSKPSAQLTTPPKTSFQTFGHSETLGVAAGCCCAGHEVPMAQWSLLPHIRRIGHLHSPVDLLMPRLWHLKWIFDWRVFSWAVTSCCNQFVYPDSLVMSRCLQGLVFAIYIYTNKKPSKWWGRPAEIHHLTPQNSGKSHKPIVSNPQNLHKNTARKSFKITSPSPSLGFA